MFNVLPAIDLISVEQCQLEWYDRVLRLWLIIWICYTDEADIRPFANDLFSKWGELWVLNISSAQKRYAWGCWVAPSVKVALVEHEWTPRSQIESSPCQCWLWQAAYEWVSIIPALCVHGCGVKKSSWLADVCTKWCQLKHHTVIEAGSSFRTTQNDRLCHPGHGKVQIRSYSNPKKCFFPDWREVGLSMLAFEYCFMFKYF